MAIINYPPSGGSSSTGPVEFNKDGAVVEVNQDTGTPANNLPLPVTLLDSSGHVSVMTANGLKVDGSAVTQPVSGTVTANQGGAPWSQNITQIVGSAPGAANTLPVRVSDGTSFIDPRSIRALTSADVVTANQGGAPWSQNITQVGGAVPSATNGLSVRITNGVSFLDPTAIRALTSTDVVTALVKDSAGTSITLGQKAMTASFPVVLSSDQAAIPVTQSGTWSLTATVSDGTAVATQTAGTSTTSAVQLFASNVSRKKMVMQNFDSIPIFIGGDNTTTTDSGTKPGIRMNPGDVYEWTSTGACYVISASAGAANKIALHQYT